jgi:pyruvate dehydrogenase E2 component (dihydrolipoamide acetyltransferase)
MAETVIMPKLGFDMAEGPWCAGWSMKAGMWQKAGVSRDRTDKATVEVESSYEGVVLRHLVAQGTVVPVNTPIAMIGAAGEKVDLPAAPVAQTAAPEAQEPAPVMQGAPAAQGAPATKETKEAQVEPSKEAAPAAAPSMPAEIGEVRASPLAKKMAADKKIDLRQIRGSGPGGRVVRKDIEAALSKPGALVVEQPMAVQPTAPAAITPGVDREVPLSRLRAAIGRRMTESVQQVPHFYVTHEYDMAAVMELRKQVNALLPEEEKISVNDFIVKAIALALVEFPNLNASIDLQKGQVVQHGAIHVGVAVAVESGLLTIVCKNADQKPLRQIALEVRSMAERARLGKVRTEDIEGSTFTISNLGMFDVDQFTAIINPPEAAILAVGSVKQVPVVVDGELQVGTRMKATLSVDHRVSDGAEGAKFLQALAKYLESPLRLIL